MEPANKASTKSLTATPDVGEVESLIAQIDAATSNLHNELDMLTNRLANVLSNEPETQQPAPGVMARRSTLGGRLDSLLNTTDAAASRVRTLREGLQN